MADALNTETVNTPPRDAATVILTRDSDAGVLEVLLLCRGNSKTVMNKAWVFPGGKVDDADFEHETGILSQLPAKPQSLLAEDISSSKACALFYAATRETREETGVRLAAAAVHPWSRWITPNEPSMMKKRFDARFFVAALPDGEVAVHDGTEATDSKWLTPRQALQDYLAHNITLAPPQIMTLVALCAHSSTSSCIEQANNTATYCIQPQVIKSDKHKRILAYPGDKQHSSQEKLMPGPTRLLWMDGHFEPEEGFEQYLR